MALKRVIPCLDVDAGRVVKGVNFVGLRDAGDPVELAERYEEINLLYTISEILGRTVALEEAATTILTELSQTVGARRGAILLYDKPSQMLYAVAAIGVQHRGARGDADEVR